MSIAAFAREQGLSAWKLYQANRAQRRRQPSEFVEVTVADPAPNSPLEIVLPDAVVRIPAGFDEATLQRLLGVLKAC